MFAIASLFDSASTERIWALWNSLEDRCGLAGIKTTPYPHFSWLGFEEMDWEVVSESLARISQTTKSLRVQTAGLGLFTGQRPILYLSLVKTSALLNLHTKIWKSVMPSLTRPNPYYSPLRWMPHITIAYGDLTREKIPCALLELMDEPLDISMEINNISVIFQTPFSIGIKEEFTLNG